jgi:hypothetical protein
MRRKVSFLCAGVLICVAGYLTGSRSANVVHASGPIRANVPKSYGRLVTAIPDQIGTGLIFEDSNGVIRFVSVTGMKEGQLERY